MKKPFLCAAMWASALLAGLTACSSDHAQLDLTVAGATEAIIVRIEGERTVPWDTVAITHGQLTMELPVDSTLQTFYFLLFDTGGSMRLGIQPGDRIAGHVEASSPLTDYTLEGSVLSEQLQALYLPVLRSSRLLDSLDHYRDAHLSDSTDVALAREQRHFERLEARYLAHREEIQVVMAQDSTNLANVFGFFQRVGQVPLFRPNSDLPMMQAYADAFIQAYPTHPLAIIFAQETARMAAGASEPAGR
jgi:hypothetical protein